MKALVAAIAFVLGVLGLYSMILHLEIGYTDPPRCLICTAQWLWYRWRGDR